jgi:hypothetical protein
VDPDDAALSLGAARAFDSRPATAFETGAHSGGNSIPSAIDPCHRTVEVVIKASNRRML